MLIPFEEIIKLSGPLNGIVELGGYVGENYPEYVKHGVHNCLFVEANPELHLQSLINVGYERSVLALIGEKDGEVKTFNLCYSQDLTNKGCSSILKLGKHAEMYDCIKEVGSFQMPTITLDTLIMGRMEWIGGLGYNFDSISLDLQGYELNALKGATRFLSSCKVVISEFALEPLYVGACTLDQLDEFLVPLGFERVITKFVDDPRAKGLWGDCVYRRNHE